MNRTRSTRWLAAITGGATLALLPALPMLSATSAVASTSACVNAPSGTCGYEENVYGNDWDVYQQYARVNQPVTAYPHKDGDQATDFNAVQTTHNVNERRFEYAPNGNRSGLCLSDPDGGYAGNPGGPHGLVLRTCNNSAFQQWRTPPGVDSQNTAGTQWINVATRRTVQPQGTGSQMVTVKTPDKNGNAQGSYFGWDSPGVVPKMSRV
jgi:hypothetical protein